MYLFASHKNEKSKIFFVLGLMCFLMSCTYNPSKPSSSATHLEPGEGLLILSTQDDGSSAEVGMSASQAANALFSLGLSELDRDMFSFTIKPVGVGHAGNTKKIAHSYRSKAAAQKKRWHVIPLVEGSYEVSSFGFSVSNSESRTFSIPKNLLRFKVGANEVVYLGDLLISLKEMRMTRRTSISYNYSPATVTSHKVLENGPTFTALDWNDLEAKSELDRYENFPKTLRRAKINTEILNKYFSFVERKRLEGIASFQAGEK